MSVQATIDLHIENNASIEEFIRTLQKIGWGFYDENGAAWYSPLDIEAEDDCCEWMSSKISEAELWAVFREKERQGRTVMLMMQQSGMEAPGVTILAHTAERISLLLNKNRKTLKCSRDSYCPTDFSWYILNIIERLRDEGIQIFSFECQETW